MIHHNTYQNKNLWSTILMSLHFGQVAQIRITDKELPFHLINLAVGAEIKLPISYCDALGSRVLVAENVFWEMCFFIPQQFACDFCWTGNPFYEAYNAVAVNAESNDRDVVSTNNTCDEDGNICLKVRWLNINFWIFNMPSFQEQATERNCSLDLLPFLFYHCFWPWKVIHAKLRMDEQTNYSCFTIRSFYFWPYHLTVTHEVTNISWRQYGMVELLCEYQWVVQTWSQTIS